MKKATFSELSPSLKDEIAKFVATLVDDRTQHENTPPSQSLATIVQELRHQRELIQQVIEMTDKRFEEARHYSEKRFEAVDKRFEDMNKRFEDMNKRFEDMNKRFNGIQWMIGIGFTVIVILMTLFKFLESSQGGAIADKISRQGSSPMPALHGSTR